MSSVLVVTGGGLHPCSARSPDVRMFRANGWLAEGRRGWADRMLEFGSENLTGPPQGRHHGQLHGRQAAVGHSVSLARRTKLAARVIRLGCYGSVCLFKVCWAGWQWPVGFCWPCPRTKYQDRQRGVLLRKSRGHSKLASPGQAARVPRKVDDRQVARVCT